MEKICETCQNRGQCQTPCKTVKGILWKDNRVMEKHYRDHIACLPMHGEVRFSELSREQLDSFSEDDVVQWSSGDLRLRKTIVFVERFFNKVSCKELAERLGVKENTIVCIYAQAVESIQKLIQTMDARKEGIKAMKPDKFTEDQKFFLLVNVFGFSQAEVARMFHRDKDMVNRKVKRMADQYGALFSGAA